MKKILTLISSLTFLVFPLIAPLTTNAVVEECTPTQVDVLSNTSNQYVGYTTTDPAGSSNNTLFNTGTPGTTVVVDSTGYPGAWTASSDPSVSGADWISDNATQPTNPGAGSLDGTVNTWRLFSNTFTIPAGATGITSPVLHFSADNSVQVFLDDVSIGNSSTFASVTDTAPLVLTAGVPHTLKFVVKNDSSNEVNNPTGVLYKMTLNYCASVAQTPTDGSVHIYKYIDGVQATSQNANGVSFPMFTSTYSAPFTLGVGGWSAGDIDYEASTAPITAGGAYTANENTDTPLVGASCDGSHQYMLEGYSSGATLQDAISGTKSLTPPNFVINGDASMIVWNKTCEVAPQVKVHILKYLDGAVATAVSANNYQFPMSATWQASNLNGGASTSGDYVLGNNFGGALDLYGADTAPMSTPADYTTSEVVGGESNVVSSAEQCAAGKYLLNGYRVSATSFADAANQTLSPTAPAFTGLTTDEYVIVDNSSCTITNPTTGGEIDGMKYNDLNRNGKKNTNEPGLAGWTIRLKDGNGNVLQTTVTDAQGKYSFKNLPAGTYIVREVHKNGWKRMSKNPKPIVLLADATVADVNFGNAKKYKYEREDNDRDDQRNDYFGYFFSKHGHNNHYR